MALANLNDYEPKTYHGLPVLELHAGDTIPTPRAPTRYAIRVSPDLARYLLTFNYEDNRRLRPRKIRAMSADMVAGRYLLTPQGPIFSCTSVLINGQNTLSAIIESGTVVWVVVEFGWPDEVGQVIDRVTARTNADTLHFARQPNSTLVASIVTLVRKYELSVGKTTTFGGMDVPSSSEVLEIVTHDSDRYQAAARAGNKVYKALDRGCSPTMWGATHYLICKPHPGVGEDFFDEVATESGEVRSATRELGKWFRRRPASATRTGDDREAIEVIVRAFNAFYDSKTFAFPKYRGFKLSRIK